MIEGDTIFCRTLSPIPNGYLVQIIPTGKEAILRSMEFYSQGTLVLAKLILNGKFPELSDKKGDEIQTTSQLLHIAPGAFNMMEANFVRAATMHSLFQYSKIDNLIPALLNLQDFSDTPRLVYREKPKAFAFVDRGEVVFSAPEPFEISACTGANGANVYSYELSRHFAKSIRCLYRQTPGERLIIDAGLCAAIEDVVTCICAEFAHGCIHLVTLDKLEPILICISEHRFVGFFSPRSHFFLESWADLTAICKRMSMGFYRLYLDDERSAG